MSRIPGSVVLLGAFVFSYCAVGIIGLAVRDAAQEMRAAVQDVARDMQSVQDIARDIAQDIDAMVPPNNDKLFTILSKGIGVTEPAMRTSNVGTTPASAFATDLVTTPLNQQTDAFTQEITIRNSHATQNLCYGLLSWATVGATCTLKCAASTLTCSGAATDGLLLSAGQTVQRRYDGTSCICLVGSAAATAYQTERVIR